MIEGASDDFIKEERRWEAAQQDRADRADRERRAYRKEIIGWAIFGATTVAIVAVLVFALWRWAVEGKQADTERINACTEQGGTWTTIGGGMDKMCIKVSAEVPK